MAASCGFPFLLCILYTQIIFTISQTNEQIELTPSSNSSIPDITVTPGEDCTVIGNVWSIDVTQQAGADLTISLGPTYGFHADYASTISITLNGNTSIDSYENDGDVSLIFAVNDFYFAHHFHLDSKLTRYKECPKSSNPLISRNVTEMVHNESPDRYYRFCNNSVDTTTDVASDYWTSVSPKYKAAVQWPMNIVIRNDPNTNTVDYIWSDATISTNGQVTSSYATSFDTEQGLDIFIAGDNNGEDFIITSIDISYQYTVPPTTDPTTSPVPDPTSHPTQQPTTSHPTESPSTFVPTSDPTVHPTVQPTDRPSSFTLSTPTTGRPTLSVEEVVVHSAVSATMYLDANFSDLESYAADNELSNEEVAKMIVESAISLDAYGEWISNNVDITITDVREGSGGVIIDYSVKSDITGMASSALSQIKDAEGRTITIAHDFSLILISNTEDTTDYTNTDGDSNFKLSTFHILMIAGGGLLILSVLICLGVVFRKRQNRQQMLRERFGDQTGPEPEVEEINDGLEELQRPFMEQQEDEGLFHRNVRVTIIYCVCALFHSPI